MGASPLCPQSDASCWHHLVGMNDSQAAQRLSFIIKQIRRNHIKDVVNFYALNMHQGG